MEEINYRFLQWGYYHAKYPNYASFYQNRSPNTCLYSNLDTRLKPSNEGFFLFLGVFVWKKRFPEHPTCTAGSIETNPLNTNITQIIWNRYRLES